MIFSQPSAAYFGRAVFLVVVAIQLEGLCAVSTESLAPGQWSSVNESMSYYFSRCHLSQSLTRDLVTETRTLTEALGSASSDTACWECRVHSPTRLCAGTEIVPCHLMTHVDERLEEEQPGHLSQLSCGFAGSVLLSGERRSSIWQILSDVLG